MLQREIWEALRRLLQTGVLLCILPFTVRSRQKLPRSLKTGDRSIGPRDADASPVKSPVLAVFLFAVPFISSAQTAGQPTTPLTNLRVIQLVQAGLRADELSRIIGTAAVVDFNLAPAFTDQLLQYGVSEETIKAMAARLKSAPQTVQASTAVAPPVAPPTPAPAPVDQKEKNSGSPGLAREYHLRRDGGASDTGYKVAYDGGSLPEVKAGVSMKIYLDANQIRLITDKTEGTTIPASAITEISYGLDVHRRVGAAVGLAMVSFGVGALMALSKSKKHFIGLTWDNGGMKGGVAFQADKNEYRGLLAGLEGITGKKVVSSEALAVQN